MSEKINAFKTHLDFLGYTVTEEGDSGGKFLKALSGSGSSKPNLILWFGKPDSNRVIFRSSYKKERDVDNIDQFKFMNKANDEYVSKMFTENDGDLVFNYIYTGEYNKKLVGDFIDTFRSCITQIMSTQEFRDLFMKKA